MSASRAGLRRGPLLGLVCLWLLVTGCAGFRAVNSPLEGFHPERGYGKEEAQHRGGEVLLVLAFSGGGTRAAALSYGVLEELRDTLVVVGGERKRLLDEVDIISSVSGGSFTSTYYGLYGDRIFEDFEKRFLKRNVQKQLLLQLLRPMNWFRMMRQQSATPIAMGELFNNPHEWKTLVVEQLIDFIRVHISQIGGITKDALCVGRKCDSHQQFVEIRHDLIL